MSNDDPDLAQAFRMLAALQENMVQTTRLVEKYERQRTSGSSAGREERTLRRELSEAHDHINRLYERFPETQP